MKQSCFLKPTYIPLCRKVVGLKLGLGILHNFLLMQSYLVDMKESRSVIAYTLILLCVFQ